LKNKKRGRRSILIKYMGNHKGLTHGELYTKAELAECFKVSTTFVRYKLKGKAVALDEDFAKTKAVIKIRVKPTRKVNLYPLFEGVTEQISASWLKRKLI
jgi:hypothetical protein